MRKASRLVATIEVFPPRFIVMTAFLCTVLTLLFVLSGNALAAKYTILDDSTGGDCSDAVDPIGTWLHTSKTCTLNKDILVFGVDAIEIASDNITLNGNNHRVSGTGFGNGVFVGGRTGVRVEYLKVNNFINGIFFANSNNDNWVKYSDVTISTNGIYFYNSNNNHINNCRLSGSSNAGIWLSSSSGNHVSWNLAATSSNGTGYYLSLADGNTFEENTARENLNGLVIFNSNSNFILRNNFIMNSLPVVYNSGTNNTFFDADGGNYWDDYDSVDDACVDGDGDSFCDSPYPALNAGGNLDEMPFAASGPFTIDETGGDCSVIGTWDPTELTCTLSGDRIIRGVDGIEITADGITLDGSGRTLTGSRNNTGIKVWNRMNVTVKNLELLRFRTGIDLVDSSQCSILHNHFNYMSRGAAIYVSSDNTIMGNSFLDDDTAIEITALEGPLGVSSASNNLVAGNLISRSYNGIKMNRAESNTITGNWIQYNREGMNVVLLSKYNTIYNNNFAYNISHFSGQAGAEPNYYNKPAPLGGNYWTDNTGCSDGNADGFCDSAYSLPYMTDNLPRTEIARSVFRINDDATGGDCELIGNWDATITPHTCTLSTDVTTRSLDAIEILSDNVTLDGSNHNLYGNDKGIYNESSNGVTHDSRNGVIIRNLNIYWHSNGIFLNNGTNCSILGNTSNASVILTNSNGNLVSKNSLNRGGIGLVESNSNVIVNNEITDAHRNGISLWYSKDTPGGNNLIAENTIDRFADYGIRLGNYASDNFVFSNSISNVFDPTSYAGGIAGIGLFRAKRNFISTNTISESTKAIELIVDSDDNTIYRNNFLNNTDLVQVNGSSGNLFNLPAPVGGNHWSVWTSPDSNGDGFVDTPYVFTGGQDDLPIAAAQAASSQYILRNDATGGDCTTIGNWDSNTLTCRLTSNVFVQNGLNAIEFADDNLVLDGAGATIIGDMIVPAAGLYINNRTGIVMKNVKIREFDKGIRMISSSQNTIQDSVLRHNGTGVHFIASHNNVFNRNTIYDNNDSGLDFFMSNNNEVFRNEFSDNPTPVTSSGSSNTFSRDLPIGGNFWDHFYMTSQGCLDIDKDTFCDGSLSLPEGQQDLLPKTYPGMSRYIIRDDSTGGDCTKIGTWNDTVTPHVCNLTTNIKEYGSFNSIEIADDNIVFDGNGRNLRGYMNGFPGGHGVSIYNRTGVTVRNLYVFAFWGGINVFGSGGGLAFTNNYLSGNASYGLSLANSNSAQITENIFSGNGARGITLNQGSMNNQITGNTILDNVLGIMITSNSDDNLIAKNTFENNSSGGIVNNDDRTTITGNTFTGSDIGITLSIGSQATVTGNTISGNVKGIILGDTQTLGPSDSVIYRNSFIGNGTQARVLSGTNNSFFLPKPLGGNYWNTWSTPDNNHDGFVDNPYTFFGSQDDLPIAANSFWLSGETLVIRDDATGGDCTKVGNWHVANRRCILTTDIYGQGADILEIADDNITLIGMGHRLIGDGSSGFNGINLYGRNGVLVRDLKIEYLQRGIDLSASHNNILIRNSFAHNATGIYLGGQRDLSTSNTIYHNNFFNSSSSQIGVFVLNQFADVDNIFNLNAPIGGNYWDDHPNCVNNNNDNFCDSPYEVAVENSLNMDSDLLPWAQPYDSSTSDTDLDGVLNSQDNCLEIFNPSQSDADANGRGDACDSDADGDGVLNDTDNCPLAANQNQNDQDGDGFGDVCQPLYYCVDTKGTTKYNLQQALNEASKDGVYSVIMLQTGTYSILANNNSSFLYAAEEPFGLTLAGGYGRECASWQNAPESTIITGEGQTRSMLVDERNPSPFKNILITGLSFHDGMASTENNDGYNYQGGGLYIRVNNGSVHLNNNRFFRNRSDSKGGGLSGHNEHGLMLLTNTVFANNAARTSGGGAHLSGGMFGRLDMTNNTLVGNETDAGGAVFLVLESPNTTAELNNNIMWANTGNFDVDFLNAYAGTINAYHNNFSAIASLPPFTYQSGNIDTDPWLGVNPLTTMDFHLPSGSTCIDAGLTAFTPQNSPPEDMDGEPRMMAGDYLADPVIDIGADEYVDTCPGDLDFDHDVDGFDLALFANGFGPEGITVSDITADFGRNDCP